MFRRCFLADLSSRVVWLPLGEVVCVGGPTVAVHYSKANQPASNEQLGASVHELRNPALFAHLALELWRLRGAPGEARSVVFYSRRSAQTQHGRIMPADHEAYVLSIIGI